jgi:hypothetical protein
MNMKLLDLFEGKYINLSKEEFAGNIHIVKGSSEDMYTVYIDIEFNDIVPNTDELRTTISQTLRYTVEQIKSEFKVDSAVIFIGELIVKDRLEGGGSVILIGKKNQIIKSQGRDLVVDITDSEDDINTILNNVYGVDNLPPKDECMTRLKRDHTIVKAYTRNLDVKDINIELHLLPRMTSIAQIELGPTDEDELEKIGFDLGKKLKSYKIRPQINGGPIIGTQV